MDGWMDEWMDGWMDAWMDGKIEPNTHHACIQIIKLLSSCMHD